MNTNINSDFAEWAKLPSGMDGGNTRKLWLCGIEYGGYDNILKIDFKDKTAGGWLKWDNDVPSVSQNNYNLPIKYGYNIALAKIAARYSGISIIENWGDFAGKDGAAFKMNLFPLSFPNTNDSLWNKEYFLKTGFRTKSEYMVWCMNHRYPKLRELAEKYKPKCLLCFGKGMMDQFKIAFCDNEEQMYEQPRIDKIKDQKKSLEIYYHVINDGKTLLVIYPFVNKAKGLNSSELLDAAADFAKNKCQELNIL